MPCLNALVQSSVSEQFLTQVLDRDVRMARENDG